MTRRGIAYTPAATRKYEAHDRLAAQLAMNGRPPLNGSVHMTALIELPIPHHGHKANAPQPSPTIFA